MRTLVWLGRFIEAWGRPHEDVFRKDVKMAMCGNTKANDSNIRVALIDRFGGADVAIAKRRKCRVLKKSSCPDCGNAGFVGQDGPLVGITADLWAALAVAITYSESKALQHGRA
jgi:hypothetical protein